MVRAELRNFVPASSHCRRHQQVTCRRHSVVMMFDVDACTERRQRQAMTPSAAAEDEHGDAAELDLHQQPAEQRPICH